MRAHAHPVRSGAVSIRGLLAAVLAGAVALAPAAAAPEPCPTDRTDGWFRVKQVVDGDTLLLADGQKVRLIGLNAPETGRPDRHGEPYAGAARRELERLVAPHGRVGLRLGHEPADRYGRTLAHAFLPDGTNLQRALLAEGLAVSLVVPPNDWSWACYRAAEAGARSAGRGVWGTDRFRPADSRALPPGAEGFWTVTGQVQRVGKGRESWWLNLPGDVSVRLPKADLARFPDLSPRALRGRRIEARGWLQQGRRERFLEARHPATLSVID
jgi:endonuclease YncB( thermonuclease family)